MGKENIGLFPEEDKSPNETSIDHGISETSTPSKEIREILFRNKWETTLTIPIKINNRKVLAVIDTGAEISVMSHQFAQSMKKQLRRKHEVNLKGVETSSRMKGYKLEKVNLDIDDHKYPWSVYEADIKEDFILGLDFLRYHKVKIDLEENSIHISKSVVTAVLRNDEHNESYRVSSIVAAKKLVIPPHTAKVLRCRLDSPFDSEVLCEVKQAYQGCLDEHTIQVPEENEVRLLYSNNTDRYVTVKKDESIGIAMEFEDEYKLPEPSTSSMSDAPEEETPSVRQMNTEKEERQLPEHLVDLFQRSSVNLKEDEQQQVHDLLFDFQDIFSEHDLDIGCFSGIKHKIETGDEEPVKHKLRRTPLGFEDEEKKYLKKMLDAGVIRPSVSEWACSPVLIRKKDKTVRYCLDYRDLNAKTKNVGCNWPLPSIDDCLDTLAGSQYFSTIDLAAGYWQILVEEEDIPKTAWISKYGHFESLRMPFGLKGAPSTMQRAIEYTLRGLLWLIAIGYLDDVITKGKSFKDHLDNLRKVFQRFREHNLKIKPKKCHLFRTEVVFLGRKVTPEGITVDPSKIEVVVKWAVPKTNKELERFLGFINYHREFIPNISERAQHLFKLRNQKPFVWEAIHQQEFEDLKEALTNPPMLGYPNPDEEFLLDTDASDTNIAAVLYQVKEKETRVISYGSLMLSAEQRNYCTTRKELLAVVRFTRQYRHYLLGKPFTIRTDNASLLWIMKFRNLTGQLARWVEELSQYDFKIMHRAGRLHTNADSLSRVPTEAQVCSQYRANIPLEELPCKGCRYCQRVHDKWKAFEEDVDYAIPLSVRNLQHAEELDGMRWIKQYSSINLSNIQKQDGNLEPVIRWLQEGKDPSEAEFMISSPETKHLWTNRSLLSIKDDVLFFKWVMLDSQERNLLVTPYQLRSQVLEFCHDNILAGHMGIAKTKERVKRGCYWYKVNEYCEQYVRSCSVCNQNKKAQQKKKAPMKLYHAGAPMEKIHIDILGPLKTTKTGNKYILVMIDQFTKWIELEPLPIQTSDVIAKALVDRFISRFGTPNLIISDQGANFTSQLFLSVCKLLQIAKNRTSPYRPSANGQVERSNRTILQMLRCYIDKQEEWDEHLQQIASAIRSTQHRQTGFTPNKMMLGREVACPLDLMIGYKGKGREVDTEEYVASLSSAIIECHRMAREHLQNAQKRQKKDYDVKLNQSTYDTGDVVYEINSATKVGSSQKLEKIWKGPFLVTKVLSPLLFVIKGRKKEKVVHHDRLKLCEDRVIPIWLTRMRNSFLLGEDITGDEFFPDDMLHLDTFFGTGEDETQEEDEDEDDSLSSVQEAPKISRKGRNVKTPAHYKDYVL